MPWRRLAALLVLGPCLFPACGKTRTAIRNVLLISIDTLRADHVGVYGFPRPTTPNIDAVAGEAVRFKAVYTPVPMTLPAHVSMLTGTLPPTHGLRDNLQNRLPEESVTLAERLRARGFTTGALVSSFVLDRRFGMSQGFDTYDDRFEAEHKVGDLAERKGDETVRHANAWLDAHKEGPFFFFLHLYDPHEPYAPPEPFASRWKDQPYEGEVAFADHCVGQIVAKLKQLGLYDSTLLVITGDHGEMLGEHGELNHGFFVYEGALRVPLVMRVPGLAGAGRQVETAVSLTDIVPTVLSLVGAEPPTGVQGVDLSPWLVGRGAAGSRPLYAETVTPTRYYGANSLLAVVADGWKYIETTRPELYDLRSDPAEAVNLIAREPLKAEALARSLVAILAAAGRAPGPAAPAAALDEEARQRLAALGYLGRGGNGATHGFDRSKEDPKDLIAFFRKDQRLNKLVEEKQYAAARALCDQMLRERPGFADCHLQMSKIAAAEGQLAAALTAATKAVAAGPDNERAHVQLAGLLNERGDVDAAITHLRKALALQPDAPDTRLLLGRALAEKGQLPEAVENYRRALALDPGSPEAHAYLGSALAAQGQWDEAISHLEPALRARPGSAELHDRLGMALRETGRSEEALLHFREAVRLSPDLALAHYNLARALKQRGDLEEAVRHYRRALALDPRLAQAHNGLGSVLGSMGRLAEAVQAFREAVRLQPDYAEARQNLELALQMLAERTPRSHGSPSRPAGPPGAG